MPVLLHHVTRCGNCREPVFFGAKEYQFWRRLIATVARRAGAETSAYCRCPIMSI
jgi:REP element-mobilizing transposase RayT